MWFCGTFICIALYYKVASQHKQENGSVCEFNYLNFSCKAAQFSSMLIQFISITVLMMQRSSIIKLLQRQLSVIIQLSSVQVFVLTIAVKWIIFLNLNFLFKTFVKVRISFFSSKWQMGGVWRVIILSFSFLPLIDAEIIHSTLPL